MKEDFYFSREDIDPIYMCELIPVCPINDHGDANITDFSISPKSGPQGNKQTAALTHGYGKVLEMKFCYLFSHSL